MASIGKRGILGPEGRELRPGGRRGQHATVRLSELGSAGTRSWRSSTRWPGRSGSTKLPCRLRWSAGTGRETLVADYRDVPTVTLSESSRQSLEQYGLRKGERGGPGFRSARASVALRPRREKEKVPTFAFVGRLSSNKRPQDAIRAFAIAEGLPRCSLWISERARWSEGFAGDHRRTSSSSDTLRRQTSSQLMARAHALLGDLGPRRVGTGRNRGCIGWYSEHRLRRAWPPRLDARLGRDPGGTQSPFVSARIVE